MDFGLMLNLAIAIIFVFAPALLISYFIGYALDNFIGLISAFMFIGATFGILPQGFIALSIFLAGVFIYISFLRKSGEA